MARPTFSDRIVVALAVEQVADRVPAILEETFGKRFDAVGEPGDHRWRASIGRRGNRFDIDVVVSDHGGQDAAVHFDMEVRKGVLTGIGIPAVTVAIALWWFFIGVVSVLNWSAPNVTFDTGLHLPNSLAWLGLAVPMLVTMLPLWLVRWGRLDAMPLLPYAEQFALSLRALEQRPRIADYRHAPRLRAPSPTDDSDTEASRADEAAEAELANDERRPPRTLK